MRYCEFSPWYLCENRTDLHNQMTIEFREVTDIANVLYTRVIFNGFSSAAAALNIHEILIYGTKFSSGIDLVKLIVPTESISPIIRISSMHAYVSVLIVLSLRTVRHE